MKLRRLLLQVHLWLGLTTGAVVAVVCATGAVLAFEDEIGRALHPAWYHVKPHGARLPLDAAIARANTVLGEGRVTGVTVHADPARALELRLDGEDGAADRAFADPYTGRMLGRYRSDATFFHLTEDVHRRLLAGEVGKRVVGVSTVAFLVILASGAVLWWPRGRRGLRARLTVRARAGWKRLAHDLHVSLGVYAVGFLFVMAFSGLVWAFKWFEDGIYTVTRTAKHDATPPPSVYRPGATPAPLDAAFRTARGALGAAATYTITLPKDSAAALAVRAVPHGAPHPRATDAVFLDAYTGAVVKLDRYGDRSLGARTRAAFYPLHVGSMGGLTTRVLYLLACVLGATFPVTGALIWFNTRSARWRKRWDVRRAARPAAPGTSREVPAGTDRVEA